ncbi:alginate lyase family protein [uncultured Duncaniella sp.]|uniref:alginate lyase family protein n=1 Tax=uncultured Duncaniella sp. TaxID=2768039 RepID=UPI00261123EC|nr:alginate lyase family protein [uncultured Duncaniella sp.]
MKKIVYMILPFLVVALAGCKDEKTKRGDYVKDVLREEVLKQAEANMSEKPVTVTDFIAERSSGGIHDFYSEGDYWWPDSLNPDGPYIKKDGMTNPDNFVAHRHAMIRFSRIVANLTSAYLLTGDERYVGPALEHIDSWFMDDSTKMNPNLLYAQAIKGIATGRGIGIIDTIHLIEVVQSLIKLEEAGVLPAEYADKTKEWFAEYLDWMSTHPYGIKEKNAANNHGTCWAMQAAEFAKYTGNEEMMDSCRVRFKNLFLVRQMASDGSFPLELDRTKPYGYSLFNLDAMAALCHILSTESDDMWTYTTTDGKNMKLGLDFISPYIADKDSWPYQQDVMYWDEWPVAHPAMLFGWLEFGDEDYQNLWENNNHFPENEEVIRNLPIRNPILWL